MMMFLTLWVVLMTTISGAAGTVYLVRQARNSQFGARARAVIAAWRGGSPEEVVPSVAPVAAPVLAGEESPYPRPPLAPFAAPSPAPGVLPPEASAGA